MFNKRTNRNKIVVGRISLPVVPVFRPFLVVVFDLDSFGFCQLTIMAYAVLTKNLTYWSLSIRLCYVERPLGHKSG
ncbi:hypothetical protein FB446DRAFT_118935 [Lentinula raphanica]|nr:hypothetical protein FB446DRAFT_118935 [Lentinula raphanica]